MERDDCSTIAPAPVGRPWRVVDRLGEKIFRELVGDRSAGMTQQSLAERYGISISSVKRIFKDQRLLRDEAAAARSSGV